MRLSRRACWLLIAFALWSWFIWVTLVKNIWADPRAHSPSHGLTAFLGVHVVLAIVSLTFGTLIGRLGWRGLRAARGSGGSAGAPADGGEPRVPVSADQGERTAV